MPSKRSTDNQGKLDALLAQTEQAQLRLAGVDEVGRGPLAGPVVAAAVILDPATPIQGLADSKKLKPQTRQILAEQICREAAAWSIGFASVAEIDEINILQATMLAMTRAVAELPLRPDLALVDGNRTPTLECPAQPVIGGDDRVGQISAASIIAKVWRDRYMIQMAERYPGYGFEQHKGYGTAAHRVALKELGPTPIHRVSFAPVREARNLQESSGTTRYSNRLNEKHDG